ncbi:MAG: hypothetical protein LQ340_006682, partial [Diploschistes diacapsis]
MSSHLQPAPNIDYGAPQASSDHSVTNQACSGSNPSTAPAKKRKNHRAGKKKRRRQSFGASTTLESTAPSMKDMAQSTPDLKPHQGSEAPRSAFYRTGNHRNLSDSTLESEALLDHSYSRPHATHDGRRQYSQRTIGEGDEEQGDSRTPLLGGRRTSGQGASGYGLFKSLSMANKQRSRNRSGSDASSRSSWRRRPMTGRDGSVQTGYQCYDVNNPPSVPPSPRLGPEAPVDDVMGTDGFAVHCVGDRRSTNAGEQVVDIDGDAAESPFKDSTPPTPRISDQRRHTLAFGGAEEDVCFPVEGMSELAEEDYLGPAQLGQDQHRPRRKRVREWPDLSVLDEWSLDEKEERSEERRAKRISEPVLVGGRLRPHKNHWHREEEDAPFRFTYFNEELESTIHSQTISELLQPGQSFRELFIPHPPELSDESSDEEDAEEQTDPSPGNRSRAATRQSSILEDLPSRSTQPSVDATTTPNVSALPTPGRQKRFGPRPTFWLDVLSPTEAEMKVIQRAFGIHPLTAEDILVQEAREKVELFRNYYFVNYRTFEQDVNSVNYLEPVDMYIVVFREGVISFHHTMTPHPANVRRRIRQLKDYLVLTADWISYALVDDITDVFAPLIQSVEDEVDEIDDAILKLHMDEDTPKDTNRKDRDDEKRSEATATTVPGSQGDMLRRVGQGRKKVMSLYRLLGNKADVIKGFAKRCNEKWEVAPRSEIGLYLGDIQDHILTMTGNLGHYETLLSRAHSNYLAQINIRMNERQEQTSDILGKLTVLGTIVLPMNIITGMWGMNVYVPGQDVDSLHWFWS